MLTTRMRPKISVKPLATTKYSAAAVTPLISVIRKFLGSSMAGPKVVPDAMNSTHTIGNAMTSTSSTLPTIRSALPRDTPVKAKAWRT